MQRVISYVCLFFVFVSAGAQVPDTAVWIKEVNIKSSRFDVFNAGVKVTGVDSITRLTSIHTNISDLLSLSTPVFIKTYGPGNIATPSFRGTNSEHTAVLWKGFNLQNSMMGLADFSLMPVDFFDQIKVEHGGNGALFGSGAIGGAVRLNSLPHYNSGWHSGLMFTAASFENFREAFFLSYGGKAWYNSFKVYKNDGLNNFHFKNTSLPDDPQQQQQHATINMLGLINETYFRLNRYNEVNMAVWYQDGKRDLPPTMSVSGSIAKQTDRALRFTGEWKRDKGIFYTSLRSGWFDELLIYEDALTSVYSKSNIHTAIAEFEVTVKAGEQHKLLAGAGNTWSQGYHESYNGWKSLNRFALFTSWKYQNKKNNLFTTLSLRQEFPDKRSAPIIPFAGAEYKVNSWLRLTGNISAAYRFPTLNERYFSPGGNPELNPEYGWGEELSFIFTKGLNRHHMLVQLTGFNRITDNWIVWVSSGAYPSPRNLRKVQSSGLESLIKYTTTIGQLSLLLQSTAALLETTNLTSSLSNDESVGKQLIYIPRLSHQHLFRINHKSWFVQYQQQYNGLRFTSTDNSSWLNDYTIGNLGTGVGFTKKKIQSSVTLQYFNLFNQAYVVLPERPMPGRNYTLTLSIKI